MRTLDRRVLVLLLASILSGGLFAATNDVAIGQTPSFLADVFNRFDSAFVGRAQASAAALMGYALRFLALSFTVLLVWRTVQWFLDGKHLASLIGTILNLLLHVSIILVFLVPVGSSSGYQGTVQMVSSMADTVASAASGGAFTSGSAAITTGISSMLQSGFTSLNSLNSISADRFAAQTGFFDSITSGALFTRFVDAAMFGFVAVAILIATGYAGFQLAKVILYSVVMFSLGAAVGPFFLGFLLLPMTSKLGEHWFKFMLNAAFIKVTAFFMVGVIVSLGSNLVPAVTNTEALQNLGAFAILSSYFALILVYCMVGWVLGQSIAMAGALLGGTVGGFAPGAGMASFAAGVAGAAAGVAGAASARVKSIAANGNSSGAGGSKDGSAGASSSGSSPADSAASGAAGSSAGLDAPASSMASGNGGTASAATASGDSTASDGASGKTSSARNAFVAGAAAAATAAVATTKAVLAPAKFAASTGAAVMAGTKTGREMSSSFNAARSAFSGGAAKSTAPTSGQSGGSNSEAQSSSLEKNLDARIAASRQTATAPSSASVSANSNDSAPSASSDAESVPTPANADGNQSGAMGASRRAKNRIDAGRARTDVVGEAMTRHMAETGAGSGDPSTIASGKAAMEQHNESIGRTAYVNRAVDKSNEAMRGENAETREAAAKAAATNAAKRFDAHSPAAIERYNEAMTTKKAQG